jgi:hypothetical protein
MNEEQVWIWKEIVVACFIVFSVNSPGEKKIEVARGGLWDIM